MNYLLALVLLVIVFVLTSESESYSFSGYKPEIRILMDPFPNLKGYEPVKNDANADLMESIVLLTNKEIHKRTGIQNYIIETTSMQKFSKENSIIYECRFMTMKKGGFSFGFSVVVWVILEDSKPPKLLAIRSQPTGVQNSDQLISLSDKTMGKEFLEYKIVKEKHIPSKEDFDASVGVFRDENVQPVRSYIEEDEFQKLTY
tara:strand:- start:413 stop:1018 length:606 start_codon:yes stop_codon:yes gene_type:complete